MNYVEFAKELFELEPFDLEGLLGTKDRFEKDVKVFELFLSAYQERMGLFLSVMTERLDVGDMEGAGRELGMARLFMKASRDLKDMYFKKLLSLRHFQFPKDLWSGKYKDPFAPEKQSLRAFARVWHLSGKFLEALG